jgi:ankyrin repeat protein
LIEREYSQRFPKKITRLHLTAYFGVYSIVKLLLGSNSSNIEDSDVCTPLSYAAEHSREAVVKLLLKRGAVIDAEDKDGWTPLSFAALHGHEAVVKLLLEKGVDLSMEKRLDSITLSTN